MPDPLGLHRYMLSTHGALPSVFENPVTRMAQITRVVPPATAAAAAAPRPRPPAAAAAAAPPRRPVASISSDSEDDDEDDDDDDRSESESASRTSISEGPPRRYGAVVSRPVKRRARKRPNSRSSSPSTRGPKQSRSDPAAAAAAGAAAPPPVPEEPPGPPRVYPSDEAIKRSRLPLFPFQVDAVHRLDDARGMILSFDTGNGKTLVAVTATQAALDADPNLRVVVVCPKSVIENFKLGLESYGAERTQDRYEYYSFEGFAVAFQRNPDLCRDAFLCVDEAHHARTDVLKSLRTSLKAASRAGFKFPKHATPDQRAGLKRLRDTKTLSEVRLALTRAAREPWFDPIDAARSATGIDLTPLASRSLMLVLAARTARKVLLLTATPLVNSHLDARNLVSMALGKPVMSQSHYEDLVYYSHRAASVMGNLFAFKGIDPNDPDFPTVRTHEVRVPMDETYYRQYREVEMQQNTQFGEDPWAFYCGVRQGTLGISPNPKGLHAMDLIGEGLPTVVYSAFKSNGIATVQRLLEERKLEFVSITGDTKEEDRALAVRRFNDGEVKVLFITAAGGEGIHLRGVRKVILLETGWNDASDRQVVGRGGPRRGSHLHLPPEERFVDVYHLVLVKPAARDAADRHKLAADEILQEIAARKRRDIVRVDKILRSVDIYNLRNTRRQWR